MTLSPTNFIRSALKAPVDALPRLVFADYLEDHGDHTGAKVLRAGGMPVDELTVRACRILRALPLSPSSWAGRFTRDVCEGVVTWADEQDRPAQLAPAEFAPAEPQTLASLLTARRLPALVLTAPPVVRLTPKQYLWVWRLVVTYRRQIRDREVVRRAGELLAGMAEGAEQCLKP